MRLAAGSGLLFLLKEIVPMPLSEFSLIERYFTARPQRQDVVLGVGDDAALLQVPEGMQLAVSVDTLVAGRHFPDNTAARAIGHKALAVNLSDMAAMGAEPAWATLGLTLPEADEGFIAELAGGLFNLASQYEVELVGGDTVRGPLSLSLQIHGLVPSGQALLRSGASPGDYIFVTGSLGDAGAGLALHQQRLACNNAQARDWLGQRLEYPQPRVVEGVALRGVASAAIDISDGLLADLGHILERSDCGAELQLDALPLSESLCQCIDDQPQRLQLALSAGDDYELCFCVPQARLDEFEQRSRDWSCRVSRIGRIVAGHGCRLLGQHSESLQSLLGGYDHFRE